MPIDLRLNLFNLHLLKIKCHFLPILCKIHWLAMRFYSCFATLERAVQVDILNFNANTAG